MSTGIVICSKCYKIVHQDGENRSWQHCEDKTPICEKASVVYPLSRAFIKGKYCNRGEDDWQRANLK